MNVTNYTYVGRRKVGTPKKTVHAFVREGEKDNLTYWPKAKSSSFYGCVIGTIYALEEGGRLPQSWTQKKIGTHPDPADISAWEGRDKDVSIFDQEKNISSTPKIDAAIKVLNEARLGVSMNNRLAFDLWILNAIRGKK